MKRRNRLDFTQPITRVHNIFRIRTIVNAVSSLNKKKQLPNDEEIANVLAKSGLSKYRKEKVKDRIMRRARDHLLTASYMGLLTRSGFPFGYSSTQAGKLLQKYGAEEECPKDTLEEAVFIDRILRLKLTNVYDMQRGKQYEKLRSRPCLFILEVLSRKDGLHEHQIAVATGGTKCDPVVEDNKTRLKVAEVCKYGDQSEAMLIKFYKDYGVKAQDRKNMTRNVRPLLDWCRSVGLVRYEEIGEAGRWYFLEERGKRLLKQYREKTPVWYIDLGNASTAKSALLLFYQYAIASGFVFKSILNSKLKVSTLNSGVTTTKIGELVSEIENQTDVNLVNAGSAKDAELDFTFGYDVPPENRKEVMKYLEVTCKIANVKPEKVLHMLEIETIENLERVLDREHQDVRQILTGSVSKNIDVDAKKIASLIPSVGILGQYKSEFEKEVVLLLRLLSLNAIKYQGQLAERANKAYIIRFFENNPDILVKNGIESLVECKSSGEWKSPLATEKNVPKELLIYQQYFPQVHADSIALVYEGILDTESKKFLTSFLEDSKDIVFVTKNYLINCIHNPQLRINLVRTIKKPKKYAPTQRILST
jgi:hypothetical protein